MFDPRESKITRWRWRDWDPRTRFDATLARLIYSIFAGFKIQEGYVWILSIFQQLRKYRFFLKFLKLSIEINCPFRRTKIGENTEKKDLQIRRASIIYSRESIPLPFRIIIFCPRSSPLSRRYSARPRATVPHRTYTWIHVRTRCSDRTPLYILRNVAALGRNVGSNLL